MLRDTGNSVANGDPPDDEKDVREAEAMQEFYVEMRVDDEREKEIEEEGGGR